MLLANKNLKKVASCINHRTQPRNFNAQKRNSIHNPIATISLKSLATQLLECNRQYNFITKKVTSKLHENLVSKYDISLQALKEFLGGDWQDYKDNPKSLELWANLLFKNQLIKQGIEPDNFTATTHCNACGDVYVPPALVNGGKVLGCPWCWNRTKRLPIPRPLSQES